MELQEQIMDHKDNVDKYIAGYDVSMPMEEIPHFYRSLIETLDLMGNSAITKPAQPLGIAYSLQKVARDYVLKRINYADAERALRVSLRIFACLAPADLLIQAESCRLLAILLSPQARYQEARLCDEKAVSLAMAARLADPRDANQQ
jgi:hypothetical protein